MDLAVTAAAPQVAPLVAREARSPVAAFLVATRLCWRPLRPRRGGGGRWGRGGSQVVASQAAPRGGQCESCLFYVASNALYQI